MRLAALLHDIGKFEQRQGINRNHAELGSEFVEKYFSEDVASIIAQHHFDIPEIHEKKEEVLIVKIADHLSSGEREEREKGEEGDPDVDCLLSIFCKIDIDKGELPEEKYYPLKPLEIESDVIFPKSENRCVSGYGRLWEEFKKELAEYGRDFETLYHLLWKYTWCVPSAVWRDVPDIALFDHLRTTCAIATCLYMVHEAETLNLETLFRAVRKYWRIRGRVIEDEKDVTDTLKAFEREADKDERSEFMRENFILIGGDISGIQKFIYNIKSPQKAQKGMAKRLRGRSFYLNLLTESIAHYLLDRLSLPITNLLWCGGGHFFILAPAVYMQEGRIVETSDVVKEVEREVNKFLLKEFQGELFIVLGAERGSAFCLLEFPLYLDRCKDRIAEKKRRKALSAIKDLQSMNLSRLKSYVGTCSVCGRDAVELNEETESCEVCMGHEEIGRKMPGMEYLVEVLASQEPDRCDAKFKFGGRWIGWRICGKRNLDLNFNVDAAASTVRVYRINSTELRVPHPREVHRGFKFFGLAVPRVDPAGEGVMSFDLLAKFSKGVNRLGVVRMDVDDLGKIFSVGLKPKGGVGKSKRVDNRTISRIATLSRMLDMFFMGYINKVAENFWAFREKVKVCRDCEEKLDEIRDRMIQVKFKLNGGVEVEYSRALGYEKEILCDECKKDTTPLIYITYSGGDDLFVVAPWDVAIEFAWKLRQEFSAYVANNPNITLSAGIFLCREKFPIGRSAQIAGELLDDGAKKLPEKNGVSVFGENVPWVCRNYADMYADFERLMEFGRKLESYLNEGRLSRGFVYSFLSFWSETFREICEDRGYVPYSEAKRRKRYLPRFKYLLARNIKSRELFEELDDAVPKAIPWIRIPANWALLRTRRRGGGE